GDSDGDGCSEDEDHRGRQEDGADGGAFQDDHGDHRGEGDTDADERCEFHAGYFVLEGGNGVMEPVSAGRSPVSGSLDTTSSGGRWGRSGTDRDRARTRAL